jgi:hypothetical protein
MLSSDHPSKCWPCKMLLKIYIVGQAVWRVGEGIREVMIAGSEVSNTIFSGPKSDAVSVEWRKIRVHTASQFLINSVFMLVGFKLQHCSYERRLLHVLLSQFHICLILTTNLLKTHLNIILPSLSWSSTWLFYRGFSAQILCIFLVPLSNYILGPSYPWFHFPKNIKWLYEARTLSLYNILILSFTLSFLSFIHSLINGSTTLCWALSSSSVSWSFLHSRYNFLDEWSASRKAATYTQ